MGITFRLNRVEGFTPERRAPSRSAQRRNELVIRRIGGPSARTGGRGAFVVVTGRGALRARTTGVTGAGPSARPACSAGGAPWSVPCTEQQEGVSSRWSAGWAGRAQQSCICPPERQKASPKEAGTSRALSSCTTTTVVSSLAARTRDIRRSLRDPPGRGKALIPLELVRRAPAAEAAHRLGQL